MDSTRRTSRITLRRVAMMAALAALVPAGTAEAAKKKAVKKPVVTGVSPMNAEINDVLTIRGRSFRPGRGRNTVVFKRDGARAVFVKADVATKKLIKVKVPARLQDFMANVGQSKVKTRFRIRVLSYRFGKAFTSDARSPMIGPDSPPPPPTPPTAAAADGDCDGDGVLNGKETDDDADFLSDEVELSLELDPCKVDTDKDGLEDRWEFDCDRDTTLNRDESDDDDDRLADSLENTIGTSGCSQDTDGDGVEDGFEYRSAIDLNDDEYQQPNQSLPYPHKRPYPNALFAEDANTDFDGDGLTQLEEYKLWKYTYEVTKTAVRPASLEADFVLSYSDGLQYSVSERCPSATNPQACGTGTTHNKRRVPSQPVATYAKWFGNGNTNVCAGTPCDELGFMKWVTDNGYRTVYLSVPGPWWYHSETRVAFPLLDANRSGDESVSISQGEEYEVAEAYMFDLDYDGFVSDDERDEDADGLTNYDETGGRSAPSYWLSCYDKEKAYPVEFDGTSHVDADTDGDGIRDGADDQDFDDVPNVMELSRIAASGLDDTNDNVLVIPPPPGSPPDTKPTYEYQNVGPGHAECTADPDLPKPPDPWHEEAYGWVHPYNPCLPDSGSRTCTRHPSFDQLPSPFNASSPAWYSLN